MSYFQISGGRQLTGTVVPRGNKNEALPAITAALLSSEPVVLKRVPRIADVISMVELIRAIGAEVEWTDENELRIHAAHDLDPEPPGELCGALRASFLLAAPLIARCGRVVLGVPGGDKIGIRRLDPHIQAFEALGVGCESAGGKIIMTVGDGGLRHAQIRLDEPSVMATENALMLASMTEGKSVLYPAACEPHVQGLCRMLSSMGAAIDGIGTNQVTVRGVSSAKACVHTISPDHIEIGSFLGLAAATSSDLRIEPVDPSVLDPVLRPFRRLGITYEVNNETLRCLGSAHKSVITDFGGTVPRLGDGPWPAIPADIMSILVVSATQTNGTVLFFEKMFESRLFWVDRLIAMGAQAILCDPHRVVVSGPTRLHGTVMASPDIRAGMALLIAALAADGKSEIHNIAQIDRGYESIDERLRMVGADIARTD
jgi:UDP-N-acetylglucosamine 1-carboxyvinyltransferase